MNEREQALIDVVSEDLARYGRRLSARGWQPELVVFTGDEVPRLPAYKVALVVPIDSADGG